MPPETAEMIPSRILLYICLVALPVVLFAQGVTTGSITGTITGTDIDSIQDVRNTRPLKGATIKVTSAATGAVYGAVSREGGRYNIKGLRPGSYTVSISFIGYEAMKENIRINAGDNTEVNAVLNPSGAKKDAVTVTATADRIFDPSRTGSGSSIGENTITAAPTINRSISDMARINPYTSQAETAGSDALQGLSIMGVNSRFNNFQIDGAVSNDLFALGSAGTAGSQANSNFVSLDAIERLSVNVSPYDVRQSGFTGGLVNAITRGGTNELHGSVFFFGRNEDLVGLSPDANRRPYSDFSDFQFGGRIGGPIIKNTLLFHVTAEGRLRSTPIEVALNDPGALNNFPVPSSVLDQIIDISKTQFGYDPGTYTPFAAQNNTANVIARLDWNIDEENKIQLRHNFTYAIQDRNLVRDSRNFSLSSRNNTFTSINNQTVAQWNAIIGDGASNELRLSYTQTNDERVLDTDPFPEVRVQVGSGQNVILGPERNSQANALDQTLISLTDDFSIFAEGHTITIGTHNELSRFNNLFIADYYGSYQFPNVQAFADSTANIYNVSYANESVTGTPMPRALWWMMQVGAYVMDEWQVTPQFRLTGGIRLDVPIFITEPYYNPVFSERFPGRSTSEVPQSTLLWSPRIGFNYDITGDRAIQLRGGTGLFTGRVAAVWLSNQYSNTGVDLFRAQLGSNNAQSIVTDPATGLPMHWSLTVPPPVPGDSGYPGLPTNTAAINITDHNFRLPQVWRNTVAVDFRLMRGLSLTLEGMYGAFLNQVDYANINLKRSQESWIVDGDTVIGVSPVDGRPLYAGTTPGAMVAPEFTQVLLMRSRNAGHQYSFSTQLELSESNDLLPGLSASMAYTYGRTQDLNSSTSATASSQWQFNDAIDPNNVTVGRSNFDQLHRFVLSANYRITWSPRVSTTIGVFYSGASGRPYSLSYFGDANGDNAAGGNDLIYIPRREDYNTRVVIVPPTGTDLRTPDQIWAQMMALIDANPVLKAYQGSILPRNELREPWRNQFDLHLAQELPAFSDHTLEFSWDIQNVLNLLSSEWGLVRYVDFQSYNLFGVSAVNNSPYDAQGRLRMTYSEPVTNGQSGIYVTDNFYSRWRMQFGVRYNF